MARLPAVLIVRVNGARVALSVDLAAPASDAAAVLLAALDSAAPPDVLVSECVCVVREVGTLRAVAAPPVRQHCGPPASSSPHSPHPPTPPCTFPHNSGSNMLASLCTPSTPWPTPA